MALSNDTYIFKSNVYFHITYWTFMFSHVCQWGKDYVFFFILQKLLKKLTLV